MGIIFRVTWANGSHGNGLPPRSPLKRGKFTQIMQMEQMILSSRVVSVGSAFASR